MLVVYARDGALGGVEHTPILTEELLCNRLHAERPDYCLIDGLAVAPVVVPHVGELLHDGAVMLAAPRDHALKRGAAAGEAGAYDMELAAVGVGEQQQQVVAEFRAERAGGGVHGSRGYSVRWGNRPVVPTVQRHVRGDAIFPARQQACVAGQGVVIRAVQRGDAVGVIPVQRLHEHASDGGRAAGVIARVEYPVQMFIDFMGVVYVCDGHGATWYIPSRIRYELAWNEISGTSPRSANH